MPASHDAYRPEYHVTPKEGWINDPNGLVYFRDEWHLFYQYYNPEQVDGMQWGHAVSTDLVHWTDLPPALAPDQHGQIWSGSAVVDHEDSSGLFGGEAGMVCLYTYWDSEDHRQSQGLAYSKDGRTFHKYAGNPVIPQLRHLEGHPDDKDFRDPKILRYDGRWIMIAAGGKVRIFSSDDLIHWTFESVDDDLITECPDLFPLAVDGGTETKWVLSGGGRWYRFGTFDGKRFLPEDETFPFGAGPDYYATQTWSDTPDGRRIGISWIFGWAYDSSPSEGKIRNAFPTSWSGGSLTVPAELTLVSTPDGPRMAQNPVAELEMLRTPLSSVENKSFAAGSHALDQVSGKSLDLELVLAPGAADSVAIRFPGGDAGYAVGYDAVKGVVFIDRSAGPDVPLDNFNLRYETPATLSADGQIDLRILLDHSSLEVYACGGRVCMSAFVLPDPERDGVTLEVAGDSMTLVSARAYRMQSAQG